MALGPQAVHPHVVWESKLITEGLPLDSQARAKRVRPSHPRSKSKDHTVTVPGSFQGQSRRLSPQLSCHLCVCLLPASPPSPLLPSDPFPGLSCITLPEPPSMDGPGAWFSLERSWSPVSRVSRSGGDAGTAHGRSRLRGRAPAELTP